MLRPIQQEERRKAGISSIVEGLEAGLSSVGAGTSSIIGLGCDKGVDMLSLVVRSTVSRVVSRDLFLMEDTRRIQIYDIVSHSV